jgi:predicted homoserine dehydrogenase-like protein
MHYWGERNGISLNQVTSFTDGTKLQIEQALVANGLGADIAQRGLLGPVDKDLDVAGSEMARHAMVSGRPISDYVLNRKLAAGVFITGTTSSAAPEVLRYLKMGDGPFYTIQRHYHLCHLEAFKTIRRVVGGGGVLLNNSAKPSINVVAVAKQALKRGQEITQAIGGFQLRGEAARYADEPNAVPLGLLQGAKITRVVEPGQTLAWDDVELPENLASEIGWKLRGERQAALATA